MSAQLQATLSSAAQRYFQAVVMGNRVDAPVRARLEAANALHKAGRFEIARMIYESVLQDRPSSYRALLNLGDIARRRKDHAAAVEYFRAALARRPHDIRLMLATARELRRTSRLAEAEALLLAVLKTHPQHAKALTSLGHVAAARDNPRLALQYYRDAVAANPARTDSKLGVAAQLAELWRTAEARQTYADILAEHPDHATARRRVRKLPHLRGSRLPPLERATLERDTFTRADEWGGNLEALGMPALGLNLLTLAQDFASGASETVMRDCILIRRDDKTKILPLVADRDEFDRVLKREAMRAPPGSLFGYVSDRRNDTMLDFDIVESHHEFVYRRETAAAMAGHTLSKCRYEVRRLLRHGAHIEPIGPNNLDRVLACNERWFANKHRRGRKTYYRGRTVWTLENLPLLSLIGTRHLAVVLDEDVVGYEVSSHIGRSWVIPVFRKCDRDPPGIAPYLLSEIAKLYPDREWINEGPAVRKPGLAWFKERFTWDASEQQITMGWLRSRPTDRMPQRSGPATRRQK